MKKHITDTVADRARCPAGKRQDFIRDTELRGFLLRVGQTSNTFCFELKRDGKSVRTTIGDAAAWTVADAREKARELRRAADRGEDIGEKPKTLADAWRRFEEIRLPDLRPHTQDNYLRYWSLYIQPALGAKRLCDIKRTDVEDLHRSLAATPVQANRVHAQLRGLIGMAVDWEWVDRNVASGVKVFHEEARADYLEPSEVAAIFEHLPKGAVADVIRVLLQTGARPAEVYGMRWSDVDLYRRRWTKPASRTKQRRAHRAVLSEPVAAIVARQPRVGGFVFVDPRGGELRHSVPWCWKQTLKAAGLRHHRLYDCRHSVASALASAGVDLYAIGKHLGHANPKTTARYSHLFEVRQREVADIVAFPPRKVSERS